MRGADDPALAILMARATASDKIIDRINRRRRRAQVEPAVGAHHVEAIGLSSDSFLDQFMAMNSHQFTRRGG